ncbi:hypothetical protein PR003_g13031 [Phytophthora rubi]|uniref:Uncharacterized protein n=1 Tax=Phytophthora rubi TaxID=129364 RepID=A0A6A4F7L3_9STRA|nr:hypothetical protein PR002_g12269 [Phytophthora rubi]KAE9025846.1 hypothetical protein PR001_g12324 [Phytophthora rubi]KAE9335401.1 hypothetical protein PR003_g13031 [Phytophthora rubi]
MADTETKAWLKAELVSALGFAEVDEIVAYVASTFRSKQEASNYLVELLGIPSARAEHIGTRLFGPAPAAAAPKDTEGLVPRPTAANSRLRPSKKGKKGAGKAAELLNNALIINCLRCGRIEYNGARCCAFCDSELHYEADAATADHAAQQHMEELVQLDETGAERMRVLDAEQYFYDEEQVGQRREEDESSSSNRARRPISMALDLENRQFVDVKIARNEQLAKDARALVDGVQRKMSKGKRSKGGQQTETPPRSGPESGGIREALVVVDDSYNLLFV